MKKIELNTTVDKKEIDSFVAQIQKEFKEYDVNESNVIDFSLLLDSNNKCLKCKGLECCENENNGYRLVYEDNNFKFAPCKYH